MIVKIVDEKCRHEITSNINLLDRALCLPSRTLVKNRTYNDGNGFKLEATKQGVYLPNTFDKDVLYSILFKIQDKMKVALPKAEAEGAAKYCITYKSVYAALKEAGLPTTSYYTERWCEALEKWNCTRIIFEAGAWYLGNGEYTDSQYVFTVVTSYTDNGTTIDLHPKFVEASEQLYTRKIFLAEIHKLKSPLSLRLYEVLCHNFIGRTSWKISLEKLALKLGCDYHAQSVFKNNLNKAISHITAQTHLHLGVYFTGGDLAVFTKKT